MTSAGTFIFITGLMVYLLTPIGGYSQYKDEHIFWEDGGTSAYYQNEKGATFHIKFPTGIETEILNAGDLIQGKTKKPLHLLFYTKFPKEGAALIFSNKETSTEYGTEDDFWSFRIDSQKLLLIGKPIPKHILDQANIYSYYQKGLFYLDNHKPDSANQFLNRGLTLSKSLNDDYLLARGLYLQSQRYIIMNLPDSAKGVLQKALFIFEKSGVQQEVAACYTSYSIIFLRLGDFSNSLYYGLKALRVNEQLGYRPGISRALSCVGNVYLSTGHLNEALLTFNRALTINSLIGKPVGIERNLLNIGAVYQKKGALDSALLNYRQALKIAHQLDYKLDERILLTNIGSALRGKGKPDSSIYYLNKAFDIARKHNIDRAHLLNDIVETYLELDNPEAAKNYALLAIKAAEKEQDLNQRQYAWLMLSRANASLRDYQSAYLAMNEHRLLKDSIFNNEKMTVLNELKVKYETEKNEQAIEQLTREKAAALFRRNTYLVSGILITIILLLLFNRLRMKRRKDRALYDKEREIDQMKTTFFSNISHEFRTPLTLILGPIHSMRDDTDNPRMVRRLNMMEHNAQRLLSLIDQLLYLSKLESGKLEVSLSRQDIVKLIRGNVMNFSSLASSKKINLSVNTPFHSLEMNFDKEKMETIFINLLSNAFKFTPKGGSIKVSVEIVEQEDRDVLTIRVQDSGPGISETDIRHVFDRYYQGEEGQKSFRAGSGIGLAMVKELVQLHKGTVEVFSRQGEGTELRVLLPIGENDVLQELTPVDDTITFAGIGISETEETDASVSAKKEKPIVLVIEDNQDVMHYIEDVLQNDYLVLSAADGEAGIEKAIEEIPDLIISDVMMPKKDGYEVCDTLKQDERTSHIPLILLTARADQEDKLHGLRKKADEYLTKPFYPKELLLRAGNLVRSRREMQAKYRKELMLRPMDITVPSMEESFLQKLMQVVEKNMDEENFTVEMLSREIGMSRSQLHRKLHALTNQSATEFIRYYRLTRAMEMLQHHVGTVAEIGYKVGFSSPSYFNKMFLKQYGITPGHVRAGNA